MLLLELVLLLLLLLLSLLIKLCLSLILLLFLLNLLNETQLRSLRRRLGLFLHGLSLSSPLVLLRRHL